MKEYNRETKRWEEVDKDNPKGKGTLKRRDHCKGGRPHDFQLRLPKYINSSLGILTEDQILRYYALEDEEQLYSQQQKEKYAKLGITSYGGFGHRGRYRYLECSICGKNEYTDKLKLE